MVSTWHLFNTQLKSQQGWYEPLGKYHNNQQASLSDISTKSFSWPSQLSFLSELPKYEIPFKALTKWSKLLRNVIKLELSSLPCQIQLQLMEIYREMCICAKLWTKLTIFIWCCFLPVTFLVVDALQLRQFTTKMSQSFVKCFGETREMVWHWFHTQP